MGFLFSELDEAVQKAKAEEIRIPFGIGVAGAVAKTKHPVNIKNAYEVRLLTRIYGEFLKIN